MKKDVLGIKIDDVSLDEAVEQVRKWLKGNGKHYIVTPNPEIVMMAQDDLELKNILNNADLAIPDGVGLKLSGDIVCHTPGVEVMEKLVKLAADYGFTIGFLGGRGNIAKQTAERLRIKYPRLTVSYALEGPVIPAKAGIYTNKQSLRSKDLKELWIPDQVRDDKADLLFVAFGQGKQEKWIAQNLAEIPVQVAMGVGGSFDYLSGMVPRAPKILRELGLEWLFRLITQPWRASRQLALIQFVVLIWWKRLQSMLH